MVISLITGLGIETCSHIVSWRAVDNRRRDELFNNYGNMYMYVLVHH